MVRDRLLRLQALAGNWCLNCSKGAAAEPTLAYLDLVFAYGFARLGESSTARDLMRQAADVLAPRDEVHSRLYEAFTFRIQQALEGQIAAGPLPADWLAKLEELSHPDYKELDPRYKIDRLRKCSRILEPQESVDPFARLLARDEVDKKILAWSSISDRDELDERVRKNLKEVRTAESRRKLIAAALRLRRGSAPS